MLRFAPWKLASVLALVAAAVLLVIPSFMSSQTVDALDARLPGFIPLRQIVLGLDLQGGAYMLMQVDEASVIKSQVEALRDDVRQKMRDGKIALSGGIATQPRGVLVRIADKAERDKAYSLLQSLSQPIGGRARRRQRPHPRRFGDRQRGAADPDRRRHRRQGAPRRDAVDRGPEPPHQCDGHQGDRDRPAGREPGADRGAGPSGHHQAQGDHRADRQARIPAGGRSRRSAERGRAAADAEGRRYDHRAEARDGRWRGSGRRAAELRPADRRARRHLPLQPARRAEVRAGHDRECRPAVRHRARRQGHLGASHPLADHRRHRSDHRQFQHGRGEQPGDPAARRRLASQAHSGRGTHGRAGTGPGTRSTPASARPLSARSWWSCT